MPAATMTVDRSARVAQPAAWSPPSYPRTYPELDWEQVVNEILTPEDEPETSFDLGVFDAFPSGWPLPVTTRIR